MVVLERQRISRSVVRACTNYFFHYDIIPNRDKNKRKDVNEQARCDKEFGVIIIRTKRKIKNSYYTEYRWITSKSRFKESIRATRKCFKKLLYEM